MKPPATLLSAIVLMALGAGCATDTGAPAPLDTTRFTLENTERFVLMDKPPHPNVSCTGLQERTLADGRLEVVANVKNRESRRVQAQVSCVFRNEQGLPTGETPWQAIVLPESATETVRFTAPSPNARKYTVRVRQLR